MGLQTFDITASTPGIRLMGRMDPEQRPPALDWTGSGMEFRFRGTAAWAKLEAPAASSLKTKLISAVVPFWMARPVRFAVMISLPSLFSTLKASNSVPPSWV